ncbi:hypothetical protein SAMN06265222_12145 [Neorhodopirellula lusitana]|uniref:GYF domain-containing protein n=1 Tax=Neorhodopirellula lusitana TaxID=445327 RepID=A0ABY1QNR5_9BACT|nr:DUF4339 domain-containing protein [Neorhodopirellula lusitana]SMP76437.1 hypothetical protein SAMN06265222_12145 [Neorhodopirellula lusitana]
MAIWFVRSEGGDLGPLRPADLLTLVRDGTVEPSTMVRKDDSPWFTASEVGGLFEAARRPTIEHFCPSCNVRVPPPPTQCPKCDSALSKTRKRIIEHSIGKPDRSEQNLPTGPAASAKRWLQRRIKKDDA